MLLPSLRPTHRRRAPLAGVAALAVLTAAAACGGKDPYAPTAYYPTVGTEFTLYPLRNAPAPQPSAVDLRTPAQVRPAIYAATSAAGTTEILPNFDLAVDVDSTGHIVLLPPKLITTASVVPRTGFQISSTLYDSLGAAPGGTYQADSTFRVTVGQTIVVQAQTTACTVAAPVYAKLIIDSVNTRTGAMYLRARIDPNCGFKSFAAGVPSS